MEKQTIARGAQHNNNNTSLSVTQTFFTVKKKIKYMHVYMKMYNFKPEILA